MRKKFYTIMVTSDITSKMHRFVISKHLVKTLAIISCCFMASFIFLLYSYISLSKEGSFLKKLKRETTRQKIELQTYANAVKDLERELSYMERFDKKLRLIASLDKSERVSNPGGVGGPSLEDESSSLAPLARKEEVEKKLKQDLAKLSKAITKQGDSLRELEGFFRYQRSLLASSPSIWPAKGWVTSGFGYRKSPYTGEKEMHNGIDIAGRFGAPVVGAADGIVLYAGGDESYGNVIEIDHGFGMITRYGHNSENLVRIGQRVRKGELIAKMGNTGRSTGPHLHFEVLMNGVPINPNRYILEEETVVAESRKAAKKNRTVN